jgi:hypothetical protein
MWRAYRRPLRRRARAGTAAHPCRSRSTRARARTRRHALRRRVARHRRHRRRRRDRHQRRGPGSASPPRAAPRPRAALQPRASAGAPNRARRSCAPCRRALIAQAIPPRARDVRARRCEQHEARQVGRRQFAGHAAAARERGIPHLGDVDRQRSATGGRQQSVHAIELRDRAFGCARRALLVVVRVHRQPVDELQAAELDKTLDPAVREPVIRYAPREHDGVVVRGLDRGIHAPRERDVVVGAAERRAPRADVPFVPQVVVAHTAFEVLGHEHRVTRERRDRGGRARLVQPVERVAVCEDQERLDAARVGGIHGRLEPSRDRVAARRRFDAPPRRVEAHRPHSEPAQRGRAAGIVDRLPHADDERRGPSARVLRERGRNPERRASERGERLQPRARATHGKASAWLATNCRVAAGTARYRSARNAC